MLAHRVPVLMYHRVGTVTSRAEKTYCVEPERFEAHMQALAAGGHRAVPVESLVEWLDGGAALRPGEFVLTFDDGYAGVHEHAWPVLQQLGWPFAVFLVTDLLGQTDRWDRFDGVEPGRQRLLRHDELQPMRRRGCSFHSHTRTHAALTGLDDDRLRDELTGSRAALVELFGSSGPQFLAYPYGGANARVEAAARAAGYAAAFSVDPGFNRPGGDLFRIRRLDVHGTDSPGALMRKIRFGTNEGGAAQALRYYGRRLTGRLRG